MKENHFLLTAGAQSKIIRRSEARRSARACARPLGSGSSPPARARACRNTEVGAGAFSGASSRRGVLVGKTMLFGTSSLAFGSGGVRRWGGER